MFHIFFCFHCWLWTGESFCEVLQIVYHFEEMKNRRNFLQDHSNERTSNNAPVGIYLLKVSNRNTRTRCEICSELTIKVPERGHWGRFGFFIVNFEHISSISIANWTWLGFRLVTKINLSELAFGFITPFSANLTKRII